MATRDLEETTKISLPLSPTELLGTPGGQVQRARPWLPRSRENHEDFKQHFRRSRHLVTTCTDRKNCHIFHLDGWLAPMGNRFFGGLDGRVEGASLAIHPCFVHIQGGLEA